MFTLHIKKSWFYAQLNNNYETKYLTFKIITEKGVKFAKQKKKKKV